jgi:hypothetical protein
MNPDPGGPKTCASYGSGYGTLMLSRGLISAPAFLSLAPCLVLILLTFVIFYLSYSAVMYCAVCSRKIIKLYITVPCRVSSFLVFYHFRNHSCKGQVDGTVCLVCLSHRLMLVNTVKYRKDFFSVHSELMDFSASIVLPVYYP